MIYTENVNLTLDLRGDKSYLLELTDRGLVHKKVVYINNYYDTIDYKFLNQNNNTAPKSYNKNTSFFEPYLQDITQQRIQKRYCMCKH